MTKREDMPHPILKWAGGKSALIPVLEEMNLVPHSFKRYYEPFFGAGAMFFYLWRQGYVTKATVNDINFDLYNVYYQIKNSCDDLIEYTEELDLSPTATNYYYQRDRFNYLRKKINSKDELFERAILMIFLNRTCYSGMYRENKNGEFNVPFGNYNNPTILDFDNWISVSKSFKNVTIMNKDFSKVVSHSRSGDFIYFGPPYLPYEDVSHFIDYHRAGFDEKKQEQLCTLFNDVSKKGCIAMLSNSSSPRINNMYTSINDTLKVNTVDALRLINQKNIGRTTVKEYVITNYRSNLE